MVGKKFPATRPVWGKVLIMRLFVAIEFESDIIESLKRVQSDLKRCGLKGRFTKEENLHLTLAFIGEYGNPFDRKKFSPHVTLVRKSTFDGDRARFPDKLPEMKMMVRSIALVKSEFGKNGMNYTVLSSVDC